MTDRHRSRPPVRAIPSALAALTVLAVLTGLAGCDDGSGKAAPAGGGPSVIAPGGPGEAAETLSAEEAGKAGDRSRGEPNAADFAYVSMMIEHHRQALVMTGLADEHAGSGKVQRLADRIAAAQRPEITAMRNWLKRNGGEEGADGHGAHEGHGGHDGHGGARMPGMATEAQLEELRAARGEDFDRLFLKLMIAHHRGAVTMAEDVAAEGRDVQVQEMAADVAVQQTAEINRMRAML
ncbi:MAG TPA: DUF305 domain-containing protein [Streptomyces sp.]|uniref:DUF305 domain-containing protein n=1 Tax=Streptomyces sp. TaxID=1931 RepID=UPI002D5B3CD5|nr:DUF305 domain-containing protein [Streptomyces sp.]HZG03834.1 DUF305 domain-containing protein [Streptomyces sp.]